MSLIKLKQDWEQLGHIDPYFAVLSDPKLKYGKWDINEFFKKGYCEIEGVLQHAVKLRYPSGRELALDFGCGVGRCTRALSEYFKQCYGVDVAQEMIARAEELNRSISNCKFIVNCEEHLRIFPDNYFDMIYTNLVLQHLSNKSMIKSYICEFIRVLKESGLLVFQLPSYIPLRRRFQIRTRLYSLLRMLHFNERFAYQRLKLHPIRMNFIPAKEVITFLNETGAKVLEVQSRLIPGQAIQDRTYYVTKD